MKAYTDEQVFLGNWGEVWFDGDFMAEVKKFRAEVEISYEDVPQCRKLGKGKKMTGYEGKGEVGFLKVLSYVTERVSAALKAEKYQALPSFQNLQIQTQSGRNGLPAITVSLRN